MPKNMDFEGSGFKGASFEQKGQSERNLETLLTKLGSKKMGEVIGNFADIDDDQWSTLKDTTQSIIQLGNKLDPGVIEQLMSTVKTYFDAKFDAMVAEWLAPYLPMIYDFLNDVIFPIIDGLFNSFEAFGDAMAFQEENSAFGNVIFGGEQGITSAWNFDPGLLGGGLGDLWNLAQAKIRQKMEELANFQRPGSMTKIRDIESGI